MDDFTPQYATIPRWCLISGMGRTRTYEEAGAGNLRIIKVGGRSLVDVPHGLGWMRSLPSAAITAPKQQSANMVKVTPASEMRARKSAAKSKEGARHAA
jgi:hypothetical protein